VPLRPQAWLQRQFSLNDDKHNWCKDAKVSFSQPPASLQACAMCMCFASFLVSFFSLRNWITGKFPQILFLNVSFRLYSCCRINGYWGSCMLLCYNPSYWGCESDQFSKSWRWTSPNCWSGVCVCVDILPFWYKFVLFRKPVLFTVI
jgi:hypothetical protein